MGLIPKISLMMMIKNDKNHLKRPTRSAQCLELTVKICKNAKNFSTSPGIFGVHVQCGHGSHGPGLPWIMTAW
jgi:hypothetical protein